MTQPIIDNLADHVESATSGGGIEHETAGDGLVGSAVGEAEEGGGEGVIGGDRRERVQRRC